MPKCGSRSAFSLIELSAVILIIGIIIAGVIIGNSLYNRAIITTAKTLTQSSPMRTIEELSLWLETSSDDSLKDSERTNNQSLTVWNDISNAKTIINIGNINPTYANTINHIPGVRFAGSNNGYFSVDGKFLNSNDYTIMVVEQRESSNSNNYFIGDSSISTSGQNLLLGYNANGSVIHSQSGTSTATNTDSYSASVSNYAANTPRIFFFTSSSANGKKIYINGFLTATSSDTSKISNLATLYIGKGYSGQIGELAIFTKELSNSEISDISKYLNKKWSIKSPASSSGNNLPSCVGGTIDNGGNCIGTCPISVTGVSSSVAYPGSGSLNCDQSGYTGTVSYSCANGTASITGSCSCANGYVLVSGTCQPQCSISGIAGITNGTLVNPGTTSISCNASGYNGTINYTCINGTFTQTSGSCSQNCSFSGVTGINNGTVVASGSSSINCNATNYGGTVSYTCSGGVISNITNNCQIQCGIYTTGMSSTQYKTVGSGTVYCNASGYAGNGISYTCNSNGTYTVGTCSSCASNYDYIGGSCRSRCYLSKTGVTSGQYYQDTNGSYVTVGCNSPYSGSVQYYCSNGSGWWSGSCSCAYSYGGQCYEYVNSYDVNSPGTAPNANTCIQECSQRFGSGTWRCGYDNLGQNMGYARYAYDYYLQSGLCYGYPNSAGCTIFPDNSGFYQAHNCFVGALVGMDWGSYCPSGSYNRCYRQIANP